MTKSHHSSSKSTWIFVRNCSGQAWKWLSWRATLNSTLHCSNTRLKHRLRHFFSTLKYHCRYQLVTNTLDDQWQKLALNIPTYLPSLVSMGQWYTSVIFAMVHKIIKSCLNSLPTNDAEWLHYEINVPVWPMMPNGVMSTFLPLHVYHWFIMHCLSA